MNIRDAILATANLFECNPGEFDFFSFKRPTGRGCGTPGCAMGWIAHFSGDLAVGVGDYHDACPALGLDPGSDGAKKFYDRMTDIAGSSDGWQRSAFGCARALRLYADKYHPALDDWSEQQEFTASTKMPDWQAMARQQTVPADVELGAFQVEVSRG